MRKGAKGRDPSKAEKLLFMFSMPNKLLQAVLLVPAIFGPFQLWCLVEGYASGSAAPFCVMKRGTGGGKGEVSDKQPADVASTLMEGTRGGKWRDGPVFGIFWGPSK